MKDTKSNRSVTLNISWQSIFRVLAVGLGLIAVTRLRNLIFYLLFSLVFAVALHPLIKWMERYGLKRGIALAVTLMIIVGALIGSGVLIVNSLVSNIQDFAANAPEYIDSFRSIEFLSPFADDLQRFIDDVDLSGAASSLVLNSGTLVSSFSRVFEATIFIFFFTVYMLLEHNYLIRVVRSIIPQSLQDETTDVMAESVKVIGAYVRGWVIKSGLIGVMSYGVFRLLEVPNALILSMIIALTDIIPIVGGLIGMVPAALLAITVSPAVAITVIVLIQILSTINNNFVAPKIFGDTLEMSPFFITIATLSGLMLLGVPGIILALPVAAIIGFILTRYKGIPLVGDSYEIESVP